ncbi:Bst1p [Sugiyamaella lignohabitans]|uniref:GPI inositol-deacylase n=1 Tax=Sugiyamaella lignohabitans TaxID=796027 RepID=A0A161HJ80_9ASCO|nr:Bst1p [Sugiyamaella lignohabitans]ANB12727.1 Bst1p [Sugiyamaella lignohabitans]
MSDPGSRRTANRESRANRDGRVGKNARGLGDSIGETSSGASPFESVYVDVATADDVTPEMADVSKSGVYPVIISPTPTSFSPLLPHIDSSTTATNYPSRNFLDDCLQSPSPRIRSRSASFSKQKEVAGSESLSGVASQGSNETGQGFGTPVLNGASGNSDGVAGSSIASSMSSPSTRNYQHYASVEADTVHRSILASRSITPHSHVSSRRPSISLSGPSGQISNSNWAADKLLDIFEYFLSGDSENADGFDGGVNGRTTASDSDDADVDEKHQKTRGGDKIPRTKTAFKPQAIAVSSVSSFVTLAILFASILFISACAFSFITSNPDTKICRLPYMNESYRSFPQFNETSTRLGSRYSLHLYREQNIDPKDKLNGVPVIFIPGNAGSYRQVRSLAAEAAYQFDSLKKSLLDKPDKRGLDFFTTDFGEDLTAFHGRSLLEQAEYLNDAIEFILSLYETNVVPNRRGHKLSNGHMNQVPRPKSVILIGHSMGGIVARTMFTLSNYRPGSINTILTFAAPHSLPPVSSDPYLVEVYETVNRYWRDSFSQDLIGQNSLSHVSVVSIAGGTLDQMIPSDHASVSSMIPPTNGITVFTSTIPFVWSGIDHQAIIWCDQLRKVVAAALLDIVDARVSTKTKSIGDRMQIFSQHFLTGLENESHSYIKPTISDLTKDDEESTVVDETTLDDSELEPDTLLAFDDVNRVLFPDRQHLRIDIGSSARQRRRSSSGSIYQLPIPSSGQFSLLTDQKLVSPTKFSTVDTVDIEQLNQYDSQVEQGVYVLACRYAVDKQNIGGSLLSILDMSKAGATTNSVTLVCKNMASFAKYVPVADASYTNTELAPPDPEKYSSFIHYNASDLSNYDFITVVDSSDVDSQGFLVADIEPERESLFIEVEESNPLLFALKGKSVKISNSSVMVDVSFKTVWSSLLAYHLTVGYNPRGKSSLFRPFFRQYVDDPHESKFYLHLLPDTKVNINVHSIAPFSPFNHKTDVDYHNLHFQVWSDNSSTGDLELLLELDPIASLGKLVLHYRVALAYFPVCITALVFLVQLHVYNISGLFVSFGDGLRIFTARYLLALLAFAAILPTLITLPLVDKLFYLIEPSMDPSTGEGPASAFFLARKNQFFLGLERGHLWVLGPLFILVAVGVCHATYCIVLFIVNLLGRITAPAITTSHDRWLYKLFNTLSIVLLIVSTGVLFPYQLSFVILCLLQLVSAISQQSHLVPVSKIQQQDLNLLHLTISVLIVMIWIMPTNLTTLAVYVHNLRLRLDMPFHPFDNLVSIVPIILLCERINSGHMIPRMARSAKRILTYCMIGYISGYSLIFGMQRMYWIYHLVNFFAGWLWAVYAEVEDGS